LAKKKLQTKGTWHQILMFVFTVIEVLAAISASWPLQSLIIIQ